MRKTVLFIGSVCGLSIPLQLLALTYNYDSFAIKKNPLLQTSFDPIYTAGYHCSKIIYNPMNIPASNPADFGPASINYTGVGYSTDSLEQAFESAQADCQKNKVNDVNGRNSWTGINNFSFVYSTFVTQVDEYNKIGSRLENYPEKTYVGKWYCTIPGYHSGFSYSPLAYAGAIGYGDTQSAALTQMTKNFSTKNSPKSNLIAPPRDDLLIYRSYNLLDYPSCARVGMPELIKVNSSLTAPTIASLPVNPPLTIQGYISNLEVKGSDVRYACFVSDSPDGTFKEVSKDDGCVVGLGDTNFFVVRSPILGATDKWIKIQAKRVPTIEGDGVSNEKSVTAYSNSVRIPAIPKNTTPIPLQPLLTISSSDSKTITGIISNIEKPVIDYNYSCIYTRKANAEKPSLAPDLVTAFLEYSSICALKYNDNNNTMSITVDLSKLTEPLKGQYFAVRVYKKSIGDPYYSAFSRALPFVDIPCEAPTSTDFGDIDKAALKNYNLNIPFKSTRTLATQASVLGWDKQTRNFTKTITVSSSNIIDSIDKADQNGFYDYHVYNMCEDGVKSQSYCLIRVFNPNKDPDKTPLICATE